MTQPRALDRLESAVVMLGILTFGLISPVLAQDSDELFAGDSVRVDLVNERFEGRVLRVDGREFTVVARAAPRCTAGLMHGEGPICDPAPLTQRTMDLGRVTIQRHEVRGNLTARSILGGLIGGAAFAAIGYAVGPSLGFGKVGGCQEGVFCSDFDPGTGETVGSVRERQAADQKASDQRRGALFFSMFGGTLGVMIARKLSVGWVDVHPTVPVDPSESWGLSFRIPAAAR